MACGGAWVRVWVVVWVAGWRWRWRWLWLWLEPAELEAATEVMTSYGERAPALMRKTDIIWGFRMAQDTLRWYEAYAKDTHHGADADAEADTDVFLLPERVENQPRSQSPLLCQVGRYKVPRQEL